MTARPASEPLLLPICTPANTATPVITRVTTSRVNAVRPATMASIDGTATTPRESARPPTATSPPARAMAVSKPRHGTSEHRAEDHNRTVVMVLTMTAGAGSRHGHWPPSAGGLPLPGRGDGQ